MITSELYKIRYHRTPLAGAAVFLVSMLIPAAVLAGTAPTEQSTYTEAFTLPFGLMTFLLAIVFGGWLLGTEYRQGTVKRMLTTEPRRLRAFVTKGLVGAAVFLPIMAAMYVVGWAATSVVGSMNDVTVPFEPRTALAA